MKKIALTASILFIILTFIGAGYVLYNTTLQLFEK